MNEEDCAPVLSWMKKLLAGTLVLAGNDLDIRSNSKRKITVKTGWHLFALLILMSRDTRTTRSEHNYRECYPCKLCEKNVPSNQTVLCCDICDTWNHRKCLDRPISEYRRLGKSDEERFCNGCCRHPLSNSFFDIMATNIVFQYTVTGAGMGYSYSVFAFVAFEYTYLSIRIRIRIHGIFL